jgi:hypothetical protein
MLFMLGIGVSGLGLFAMNRLPDIGRYPFQHAISMLFSPRDLQALWFLNKLDQASTFEDENKLIDSIGQRPSRLSRQELQHRLRSPNFFIRMKALSLLERFEPDQTTADILIAEVQKHPFTTAHLAAQMLGEKKIVKGIHPLRESLYSEDYLLVSKAMVALAQLGDQESIPIIEHILTTSENPRLMIYAAEALELLRSIKSFPKILAKCTSEYPRYVRNEILQTLASLIGMSTWFYPLFTQFYEDQHDALQQLGSYYQTNETVVNSLTFETLWQALNRDNDTFQQHILPFFQQRRLKKDRYHIFQSLAEALADPAIARQKNFRFFTLCVMTFYLKHPRYEKIA